VLENAGITDPDAAGKPGRSLLAESFDPDRVVLSEYHAVGAPSGAFMIRKGLWKYHYYAGFAPELFDLATDPEETFDRAADPACAAVLREMEAALRAICDPEAVDAAAKAAQAALVESFGGRDKALGIGNIGATPPPAA
jgi:choline-sulfatase